MRLLTEVIQDVKYIEEATGDGRKATYIVGPFAVAEQTNRNKRWYPSTVLEREIDRYTEDYVKKNRAVGELNHPTTPRIDYERAAHVIKEFKRDGNVWIGKSKVLENTPMGRIVKNLIDEGVMVGVSTRGLGSLREDSKLGAAVVGDDFRLCAVDVVSDPSGPGCYVNGVYEGAEWIYDEVKNDWVQAAVSAVKATPAAQLRDKTEQNKLWEAFVRALAAPQPKNLARELAKQANVSEARVRELWEQCGHDVAKVKQRLGLK